jgi:hypothetical protein
MSGSNRETESSVRGTTRRGLNCARGMTKWTNSEIRGTWMWDTRGLWMMSTGVEDNECPNQGRHGLLCQEKKVAKGDDKKLCKCWKQRLFTITK